MEKNLATKIIRLATNSTFVPRRCPSWMQDLNLTQLTQAQFVAVN